MTAYPKDALHGRWIHSHEEDTDDEMVFRGPDHQFPPARGRTSFELRPDGTYVENSPGPVDVPEESTGHWSLAGNSLVLGAEGGRPGHAYEVASADGERLIVKK